VKQQALGQPGRSPLSAEFRRPRAPAAGVRHRPRRRRSSGEL